MAEKNQNGISPIDDITMHNDSSNDAQGASANAGHEPDSTKRAAAKRLIERYYFQLTQGCGKSSCTNEHCLSSGKVRTLSPNQAAAQALVLFARKAKLCEAMQNQELDAAFFNRDSLMQEIPESSQEIAKDRPSLQEGLWVSPGFGKQKSASASPSGKTNLSTPSYLTEEILSRIIETCKENNSYLLLIRTLGHIFSNRELIGRSFVGPGKNETTESGNLSKEQRRALEKDLDKDKDSQEMEEEPSCSQPAQTDVTVDVASLRRSYKLLETIESLLYESPLVHALIILCETLELDLKYGKVDMDSTVLNSIVIMFELPWLGIGEYFENVLPALSCVCAHLPISKQALIVKFWAANSTENLLNFVQILQQLISFKVLAGDFNSEFTVNDDATITACVKVMRMVYYVNLLASSKREGPVGNLMEESMDLDDIRDVVSAFADEGHSLRRTESELNKRKADPLAEELGLKVSDCRNPIVPFSEFYNEPLSDAVEMDRDFAHFTAAAESYAPRESSKISFLSYSFILTPAAKALGFYYDNRIRMYSERRMSIFHILHGQPTNPYLKLKIRREHVVDDALIGLEMVAMENPSDLKKQLVVEFEGEQGIDEGGLSKEFFQLVIDQIFNPDYGMFTFRQETQTFWFNPTSFESDAQFTLIGIMLGLAIYNTVVLDAHLPMVVYRKLVGRKGTFEDLADWDPALWRGLKDLLDYDGDDIEETFMQNFRISYKDVFGTTYYHELKEGGASIPVTKESRREFVDLYADFLLNKSVESQFRAFRRGFAMVTDESPLAVLFRPEEIEQLVCGSRNFDFEELQNATEYDGGYTADSDIIKNFWSVVHELTTEEKRRLLEFTTGSDRVPIGGLGRLKLVIARNGADSQRLPMAHTCYNVLLLPEYPTKERLRERLLKAIEYSKGFGML